MSTSEKTTACPTCKVQPGDQCVIVRQRGWTWAKHAQGVVTVGRPTAMHDARVQAWVANGMPEPPTPDPVEGVVDTAGAGT